MTVKSGYLNNPPKVIIIGDDNKAGSYPGLSSPRDISASPDTTRPYRDHVVPAIHSPYASARVRFLSNFPEANSTITLTSSSGKVSTFTFKSRSPFSTPLGDYDVNLYRSRYASEPFDNLEAAVFSSQKFVETVSKVPECQITAELGSLPGEVILRQAIPGTAGNTSISTTVLSTRASVENFSGGSSVEVRYPYGVALSDTDSQTSEIIRRFIKSERSGTLSAPGDADPMRFTAPADQHPYTLYRPYDESHSQQSFGVPGGSEEYGTQVQLYDEFFTRGSTLGPLDEPLWVKDKIEIDLTPTTTTTLKYTNTASIPTYGMAYYNFSQRRWEGVGTGYSSNDAYALGAGSSFAFDVFHAGFSQSCFMGYPATESGWASCTDTFGFPVHPKYHATSSQTLGVSSLVDRPFVVEKIVYEFSGSSGGSAQIIPDNHPIATLNKMINNCGGTFFILNQRVANPDPGQDTSYTSYYYADDGADTYASPGWTGPLNDEPPRGEIYTSSLPVNRVISRGGPPVYVNTVRDLVTFARVGAVWSDYDSEIVQNLDSPGDDHPAKFMDLAIEVPNSGTYGGYFTVATEVKSPQFNNTFSIYIVTSSLRVFTSKQSNTRNSLDLPTGRALSSEYCSSFPLKTKMGISGNADQVVTFYESDANSSPYLILPGDSLVFGWQAPASFSHLYDGESFSIGPGKGKLILYGSYLRDNKPVHDIYKDQLISDSVHEAIPAGPAVLDMFDTEPTMVYSGSLREEYITGSMLEISGRTITGVTDPNDLTSVRMVTARASDGNLGRRASFFRNYRIASEGEQFYDSMQPNPLDILFTYGGGDGRTVNINGATCLLSLPGETYYDAGVYDSTINQISNKNFIGSFPFETKYNQIQRVKSINSKVINSKKFETFDLSSGASALLKVSGIAFVTGSLLGDGSTSNLVLDHGILSKTNNTFKTDSQVIFIETSLSDTNPVKNNPQTLLSDNASISGINYHLSRFMGCFGPGYMGLIQYENIRSVLFFTNFPSLSKMIYRGCKYGLINPTPLQSSAVYVGTRFGQFRDMLEQRPLSVFQSGEEADYRGLSLTGYGRSSLFPSPSSEIPQYPVLVKFIDRSTGAALPEGNYSGTNSINLSPYCTSSLPYFDGEVKDRGLPLPEQSIYYTPVFPSI
jgi:hypothetical protein